VTSVITAPEIGLAFFPAYKPLIMSTQNIIWFPQIHPREFGCTDRDRLFYKESGDSSNINT
jgi:hypothetical protein